jgi:hypothetical protein
MKKHYFLWIIAFMASIIILMIPFIDILETQMKQLEVKYGLKIIFYLIS